jgi:hypothetical protein
VTIALALLAVVAPSAAARGMPEVQLVLLPPQTTVQDLVAAGFSPGVMSVGLGTVPANQTYLDLGQGNRVFDSLYGSELPRLGRRPDCGAFAAKVRQRAESAPAEIVPFLLKTEARSHGVAVFYASRPSCVFGGVHAFGEGPARAGTLFFEEGSLREARKIAARQRPQDLVVVIARPTGGSDEPVPIGIAGEGFHGNLTSDSTRTDGYVLSTDVAPTILERFGIEVPSEMSGQAIRSEGAVDPAAVESLVDRMDVISSRRGPVIGVAILAWLAIAALVWLLSRGRLARVGIKLLGLSLIYLPLVLLLGAALEPSQGVERLLVLVLSPLLAAATLAALRGYRALAVASALTVLAYAIDVVAGSPLTSLSLLGPNPGLGVRFYGIGNELEALLAVLVVAGTGAALAGFARGASQRTAAIAFVSAGLLAAFVFAAGRFGADVGAAIVFPVGAVAAALVIAGRGRRTAVLAVVAVPFAVIALLALIDLLSGANAHLTRSVLDAGGLGDLADVAQRRLQLSAHSFSRPVLLAFLPVVVAIAVLAWVRRDRLRIWLEGAPAMRAGLIGALAATAIGTLANDSGALLLEIGTAYLLVFTGFAWAERPQIGDSARSQTKSYTSVTHL